MEPQFTIEEVMDPATLARSQVLFEQAQCNSDWLQAHWADVLPQARGKFLAVAGQESFIADTSQQAWDWTATAHPEDKGALVQYVLPEGGPRIYAHHRGVVGSCPSRVAVAVSPYPSETTNERRNFGAK